MLGCATTPHTWVEWSCSQLLQNTPLHPIAEWGRQRFGGADIPAERRLADLENTLALIKLDPAENVPLLAPLLDIPLPQERVLDLGAGGIAPPAIGGADQLGDGGRQDAAGRCWRSRICTGPIRPRSMCCAASPSAARWRPCLFSSTTRPEFRPPWGMRSHHSTISLAPLDRAQVRDMVAELVRPPRAAEAMSLRMSPSAPAACRCSSRK